MDLLTTALGQGEVLTEITIPAVAAGTGAAYAKFTNKASHYAVVGIAARVTVIGGTFHEARIGVTGAGPKAVRAIQAEAALNGKTVTDSAIQTAAFQAGTGIDFSEDIHASAEYRAQLTSVYAQQAIASAVSRAG